MAPGEFSRIGELARELGFRRTLLVADRGMVKAGYVNAAVKSLDAAGVAAIPFHDFRENPDSAMVEAGRAFADPLGLDSLIGLGGGSSLDCAKGINFLLTNGGNDERLPRLRQSGAAAPADDRHPDHGRHRQRGAELRRYFGRGVAHEDGLWRSIRSREDRGPRSRADDECATNRHGDVWL